MEDSNRFKRKMTRYRETFRAGIVPVAAAPPIRTSAKRKPCLLASTCSLLSIPLFCVAYDQVEHNGKLDACEHRCSISHLPGGTVHIRNTHGGWAAEIVVNGGVIVDQEPKES